MATARGTTAKTPAQLFALVFGVVYLLVGIVGFAVTGFDNFASAQGEEKLLFFELNPMHNIVHIAIGALWIGASKTHASAKSTNLLIGVVYGLVALLGFLDVDFVGKLLNLNDADNFLHLGSAALALYFGTVGAEGPPRSATA